MLIPPSSTPGCSLLRAASSSGFLVGMTGVGAGSLMTPFLITQIGMQPAIAVGTDLLFASITKASAAAPPHVAGNGTGT